MPAALAAAGAQVRTLADIFNKGTDDTAWLTALSGTNWIVLTKDRNIRRRPLEARALVSAGLRVFVLVSADLTGEEAGSILVEALPRMRRFCVKHQAPFIAGITRMSEVIMLDLRRALATAPKLNAPV